MYMFLIRALVIPFSLVGWPLILFFCGRYFGLSSGYWWLLYVPAGWAIVYYLWRGKRGQERTG